MSIPSISPPTDTPPTSWNAPSAAIRWPAWRTSPHPSGFIDSEALLRVSEQILNPNKEQTVDVSKLDLSKFNRVSIGTDLYAERTNGEVALKAAKAAVDFDVNLSKAFSSNVQYLNSQAAQSLFTSKENTGKVVASVDNLNQKTENEIVVASSQISETKNMDKDKRGSNPFSFYVKVDNGSETEDAETSNLNSINIFA